MSLIMAGMSIPEAISAEATRRACGYKTDRALADAPEALGWAREEWDTLSPGMKREIERDLRRRGLIPDLCSEPPTKQSAEDIRRAVEYAGRKRL